MKYEEAHEAFEYRDGWLYWKKPRTNFVKAGDKAGCHQPTHWRISVMGRVYSLRHIVWLMHHGVIHKRLKHLNGDRFDCRIENLAKR